MTRLILIVLGCVSVSVSALLLTNLWRSPNESLFKKTLWSPILLIPVFGWIFYGGFYSPPRDNSIRAEGEASGWRPGLK